MGWVRRASTSLRKFAHGCGGLSRWTGIGQHVYLQVGQQIPVSCLRRTVPAQPLLLGRAQVRVDKGILTHKTALVQLYVELFQSLGAISDSRPHPVGNLPSQLHYEAESILEVAQFGL